MPTHTPLFVALLACVVIVVGALTFLPALALGPIVEHLMSSWHTESMTCARLKQRAAFRPRRWSLTAIGRFVPQAAPRLQFRNPVMFVVFVGSVLTTLLWAQALAGHGEAPTGFIFWVSLWLWFTVLFANFAEAMAEGRGKAQADALRRSRKDVIAKKLAIGRCAMQRSPSCHPASCATATSCWSKPASRFPATAK